MKKISIGLLALLVCFALPLMAQETEMDDKQMAEMPAPPPPLEDDFMSWLVGEWKGHTESEMGKSEDWMKCQMGVDGQFLMMEFKSDSPMGAYTGEGAYTVNQDGEVEAVWIDVFRDIGQGKGKREGNVMTVQWSSKMGEGSRTTEKVSDDKFKVTATWEMPDGKVMESTSEFTRVKAMD